MTIVKRKAKKKNFSIIDNGGILDCSLSWKATGLWTWLMSKPEDWEVNLENLSSSKSDGRDSVLSALSELEESGYLVYQRWRNPTGQFESAYTVFESPEQLNEWKENAPPEEREAIAKVSKNKGRKRPSSDPQGKNHSGKTTVDNPQWLNRNGKTAAENPLQLNIDKQSTELLNTELLSTEEEEPPPKKAEQAVQSQRPPDVSNTYSSEPTIDVEVVKENSNPGEDKFSAAPHVETEQIDVGLLKEIESVAMDWKKRPWRASAHTFDSGVIRAVWECNKTWYSLEGKSIPNSKKINDRLSKLDNQLRSLNGEAVRAYIELQRYWHMAQNLANPEVEQAFEEASSTKMQILKALTGG